MQKMPLDVEMPGALQALLVVRHVDNSHAISVCLHATPSPEQLPEHGAHPPGLADGKNKSDQLRLGSTQGGDVLELELVDDEGVANEHGYASGRSASVRAIAMITMARDPPDTMPFPGVRRR